MKAVVVYDSKYGNTEQIARAVAEALGTGGDVRAVRGGAVAPADIRDVDLLVVGSPTHAWGPTGAIKAFVQSYSIGSFFKTYQIPFCFALTSQVPKHSSSQIPEVKALFLAKNSRNSLASLLSMSLKINDPFSCLVSSAPYSYSDKKRIQAINLSVVDRGGMIIALHKSLF